MKTHHCRKTFLVGLSIGIAFAIPLQAQTAIWNGSASGVWSGSNWTGSTPVSSGTNDLVFNGSTNLSTTNDLTNYTASSIVFNQNAGAFTLSGNAITLSGSMSFSNNPPVAITQTINLDVSLSTISTVTVRTRGNIAIAGNVSGVGGISLVNQNAAAGSLTLSGSNSYSGGTSLNTLAFLGVANNNALGTGGINFGSSGQIQAINTDITLANTGTFTTLTASGTQSLTFAGKVSGLNLGSRTITNNIGTGKSLTLTNIDIIEATGESVNRSLTISGTGNTNVIGTVANGASSVGSVEITNTGVTTFSGSNSYTGNTAVNAGTLVVNGYSRSSAFTVASGATLGGIGSVGNLTIQSGGTLAPGNSPGVLATGNLSLNSGATLAMELTGNTASPVAGVNYDQVNVTGSVILGGELSLNLTGYTNVAGSVFFLVNNDGSDLVSGVFSNANFSPSTVFTLGGQQWQINYNADSATTTALNFTSSLGNDVALMAVPEPSTLVLFGIAAGYGLIFRRRLA